MSTQIYRGLKLDPFQAEAIAALEAGESVLVSAPTGTGKTVVADWMVERILAQGREVVYTAPIKALSNQKYRDYCRLFGEDRVGLVTGDLVIRRDSPCRVMTTEILRNMLLVGEQLPHLGAVIIDEIHFLDDAERGTTWEELLIYLPRNVQIVGLSATLSNLDEFADWLAFVRGSPVRRVVEEQRAVPLSYAIATVEGGLRSPADMDRFYKDWERRNAHALRRAAEEAKARGARGGRRGRAHEVPQVCNPTRHGHVFELLWPDGGPYLYFTFSRKDAENMARALARRLRHSLLEEDRMLAVRGRLEAFNADPASQNVLDQEMGWLLEAGIAFHHAGLHVQLKALVEELYERKLIEVLYCTGTFALGINMPARSAVFDGMMRFDGKEMIRLPTREFMQMAGRAGRRGMDDSGNVVIRADLETWPDIAPQLKGYLSGRYEPVRSRFSLSFNSIVNLLERHPRERIQAIVGQSFLAWQRRRSVERDQAEARRLEAWLRAEGWSEGQAIPPELKRDVKALKQARLRATEALDRTWTEFEDKERLLHGHGYIGEDGTFHAGARALRHIQIAEIFVTELFLAGIFDELEMNELFGVLCGIVASLPRAASTHAGKDHKGLGRRIEKIRMSEIVTAAEIMTHQPVTWDPQMIAFGQWWAEGRPLSELLLNVQSPTDISGDLVGAFRRAKDLASQLRDVYEHDPAQQKELEALCRKVTRDEVEVVD